MMKLTGQGEGGLFVLLVLEPENIERLRQGQPIPVRLEEILDIPTPIEVVIHFTENMKKLRTELQEFGIKWQDRAPKTTAAT
jgi:hypothetical protein